MRIGADVDGVIYRFTKAYHLWMNFSEGLGLDPEVEAQIWDWFTDWQTVEEFLDSMHNAVDAGHLFWQGDLYEATIPQNIADLRAAGHTVHIVTHRFSGKKCSAEDATRHFFEQNNIQYDTLHFSGDKTSVKTDYFIEDNINNYDALDAKNTKVYLINRPYNLQNDSRRRVNSFNEYTKIILGG